MSVELRSIKFRSDREALWFELEDLVNRVESGSVKSLSPDELTQLTVLYRYALSSLSTARAISLDQNVVRYLDSLCARAFAVVYGTRKGLWETIVEFFDFGFPEAVRELRWHVLLATTILMVATLMAYIMVAADPEYFYAFVDPGLAGGRGPTMSTEDLRKVLFDGGETSGSELAMFASFLVSNNARIGMMCFALGFAAGLPVFYLLFKNGLMLGAFIALYDDRGLSYEFFSWILPHGITEFLAVILCGAAGFRIGQRLVAPGEYSRWDSVKLAGREAGRICIGAVVMFFLAAVIEGFFRQLVSDVDVRYAVATATALFWLVYFTMAGRNR